MRSTDLTAAPALSVTSNVARGVASGVLAIAALYLTIWPHELGHAIGAWGFGCKASWWKTDLSWFLWGSFSGTTAEDERCLQGAGAVAQAVTSGAGMVVNLVLMIGALVAARWMRDRWQARGAAGLILVAAVWWALANYAELFSYLLLNTLWLKSDMQVLVEKTGVGRWIWFTGGLLAAVWLVPVLRGCAREAAAWVGTGPRPPRWYALAPFVLYVAMAGAVMAWARIRLT
jgi:hypothetical protein